MNIRSKNTKTSINIYSLKNTLSSLRDRLVVYVHTPIQLSYLSILLPSINRSVVLLCNFKIINNSNIPLHAGISCGRFFNEDDSICGCDDIDFVFSETPTLTERISFYIHYLHPESIVLLSGESNEEKTWSSLAKKKQIKTLQLYDGYSQIVKSASCDEEIRWEETGCLIAEETNKKADILIVSLQRKSDNYEAILIDLIELLTGIFPLLEFYIILHEKIDFSEEMMKKVYYQWSNVHLESIQVWPQLLCKSKVVVSDDLSLLYLFEVV